MTEIRTTKMVEQTEIKFVANDGMEFIGENAKTKCEDYERRLDEARVEKEFNKLDVKFLDVPVAKWWYGDDMYAFKITLYSKKDYIALMDYLSVVKGVWDGHEPIKEPITYPCTTVIGGGYDWAYDYGDVDFFIKDLRTTLEQLI